MPDLLPGFVLREDPRELPIMHPHTPRGLLYPCSAATRPRGVYAKLMTWGNAVVSTIRAAGASAASQQSDQLITLALE